MVRLELGSNEAIKQAISGGLGLSVLSKHTLIEDGQFAVFPFRDESMLR